MTSLQFDEWQDAGGTPVLRFNAGALQAWNGSSWVGIPVAVNYVVVAGGGGGGIDGGNQLAGWGGGGAARDGEGRARRAA